jgi:hypothetical protein
MLDYLTKLSSTRMNSNLLSNTFIKFDVFTENFKSSECFWKLNSNITVSEGKFSTKKILKLLKLK